MTQNATCIKAYDFPLFWLHRQLKRKQLLKDWQLPVSLTALCLQGSTAGSARPLAPSLVEEEAEEEQKDTKAPAAVPPRPEDAEPVSGTWAWHCLWCRAKLQAVDDPALGARG